MLFVCHSNIWHKHCLKFLLGVKMAPRETENNAYAKFWGDKQRALWYVMVFSGAVIWECVLREQCESACFVEFQRQRCKPQYFKIYSLKCDEIWQKSCSYRTPVNESLKLKVEQRSFETQSSFSSKLFS